MRCWRIPLLLTLATALVAPRAAGHVHDPRALEADPATATAPIAPVLEGLGELHFPVTTSVLDSQRFFDQGLRLTYGFNHSEALRAFKEAVRLDPANAMAWWGWALVLGPNLNLPMVPEMAPRAWRAISAAMERRGGVSERERAYIEALARRYSAEPGAERSVLDRAYAEAMGELVERYPDDLDAATLYAAALMDLTPWDYWYPDGGAKPGTERFLGVLESVIDRDPDHIGALHYYIHAVEARHPERGEASADRLAGLAPGAGHLVHMPSHIYMRLGRYADSWESNVKAVEADEAYITQCRAQGIYPLAYYPHNIHFLAWAAMSQGRSAAALEASRKVAAAIPQTLAADKNLWAIYETFLSQPLYALVRFGRWQEVLAEPKPALDSRFMTGVWHYARGLAFVHTGRPRQARKELAALTEMRRAMATVEQYIGFGPAHTLLTIAEEIVAGELEARRGDYPLALAHLERAVRLEDGLLYNEPPDWYFPVRHLLGAVLLEAGRPAEAEVVYWADLRRNPGNGYSLFGLAESLAKQGKHELAEEMRRRFDEAWSEADVALTSSRF